MYVSMAKVMACEAAVAAAGAAIQIHGGIGVTWEHDLHFYLRRAKFAQHMLGEPSWHLGRIGAALLGETSAAGAG
jgi:alkylation response protein AidB-like acyl-CoA dehydrogenase